MKNFVQMLSWPGPVKCRIDSDLLELCTPEEMLRAVDVSMTKVCIACDVAKTDITGTIYITRAEEIYDRGELWIRFRTQVIGVSLGNKSIYQTVEAKIFRGYADALEEVVY